MLESTILVLMIEDNADERELIAELLKSAGDSGIEIIFAFTLAEGLQKIETLKINVILLDVRLPDSSGIGTVRAVIEAAPDLAVIVMTNAPTPELALEAIAEGAQDVVDKENLIAKDQVTSSRALVRLILFALERNRIRVTRREKIIRLEKELNRLQGECTRLRAIITEPLHDDSIEELRAISGRISETVETRLAKLAKA